MNTIFGWTEIQWAQAAAMLDYYEPNMSGALKLKRSLSGQHLDTSLSPNVEWIKKFQKSMQGLFANAP